MTFDWMKPVEIGEDGIRILPLAFESFGVRGMATYVETDDISLLVDPGSALGPRFGLSPHELEYIALARSRERIIQFARRAKVLTISHYHFDHYVPFFENWAWIWSSPEMAERVYKGKLILAKDPAANINSSQRQRGYLFWKKATQIAEVQVADGKEFTFGKTKLRFSRPVPHGVQGSKIGKVLMLTIETQSSKLVHASDVQGPVDVSTLKLLLKEKPDVVILGGPPLYLKGFRVSEAEIAQALENLQSIVTQIPRVVVDHHLLRCLEYRDFLSPVIEKASRHDTRVETASELVGRGPELLEAKRKELHREKPVDREWYKKLERGEIVL